MNIPYESYIVLRISRCSTFGFFFLFCGEVRLNESVCMAVSDDPHIIKNSDGNILIQLLNVLYHFMYVLINVMCVDLL